MSSQQLLGVAASIAEWGEGLARAAEAGDGPLDILERADVLAVELDDLREECVRLAREQGKSWEVIGASLGISKQAAQKRFGR